jgi:hypothetical protein
VKTTGLVAAASSFTIFLLLLMMMISSERSVADEWWSIYNDETSFLPLYLPATIWISTFLYCKVYGHSFHRWYTLHNFHNFGAMMLGVCSIYYNNDTIFHERITILWSIGYFIIDLFDCILRMDIVYALHAVFCLSLGIMCYCHPIYMMLRMDSKATFCELSNPFMHLAKQTRRSSHFLMFAIVFTCCRIVWLPYLAYQLWMVGITPTDPKQLCLLAFYGLNCFWYYKILRILYQAASGKTDSKSKVE